MRSETHLPSPQGHNAKFSVAKGIKSTRETNVRIDSQIVSPTPDYLETLTASFVLVHDVTSHFWPTFIYKSTPLGGNERQGSVAETCALADPAETVACEMVFLDDTHCHYGSSATSNVNGSQLLRPSGTSWDVYIKPGTEIHNQP